MTLPDSGERTTFSTGSVRDAAHGKPSPLLLPWEPLVMFDEVRPLANVLSTRDGDIGELWDAVTEAIEYLKDKHPELWWRVTLRFHDGAAKYSADNWQKGQNLTRLVESFGRHFLQWLAGLTDEDHLGAAGWNLVVLSWTIKRIKDGDLPLELDDWSGNYEKEFWGDDTPDWPHEDEAGRVMPPVGGEA